MAETPSAGFSSPHNLTARAAIWSAHHRKTAIFGWLALVVASVFIGGAVGTKSLENNQQGVGESGHAQNLINDAFPKAADETVLIKSDTLKATDTKFKAVVAQATAEISKQKGVQRLQSPYATKQISKDGNAALINFQLKGDDSKSQDEAGATLAATRRVQEANPGFTIGEFGQASAAKQLTKSFQDDFKKAETLSLPITLIILLIAFGALVAAGIPLLLAATAVAITIGLLAPISQISPVDQSIDSIVLLIGLAVGVDYSMFYVRREREERAKGRSEEASLEIAAATSGRAVLVSGLTVMIAMAGMYLGGAPTFRSFATGTILVVAVALVGSLTVLPAVLSKLGDNIERARVPFIGKRKREGGESKVWAAILDPVLRHPWISSVISAGALLALCIPVLGMHTSLPGIKSLPQDLPVIKTYNQIQGSFPGNQVAATVVVQTDDITSPQGKAASKALVTKAIASNDFEPPPSFKVSSDHTTAQIDIPIKGDGTDSRSDASLANLRDNLIPATVGKLPNADVAVTGFTAQTVDFNSTLDSHVLYVFLFVLGMAFLLLLVTFRSIVIPLTAILLNLLSVGAAYGVLVLIFQDGRFESALDYHSTGAITSWLPLFLFVVLFGLSMDYHVFILSRIREGFDDGLSSDEAVAHGIKSTAGVVTSAAAIMIAVFAVFATLSALEFKQVGVGLSVAVLIDATIVRAVLLPSVMKILGRRNWFLPRALDWLPHLGGEPEPKPGPAGA
jgi:RND superfamily putative drug exporter